MAIWQFRFNVIHRSKRYAKMLEDGQYDAVISWVGYDVNEESVEKLKRALPIERSWCDGIVQYGNQEKTNVHFFYEGDILMEISCSVDVRNVKKETFDEIVRFIKCNNAMVIYNNEIYDISEGELVRLMISSDAYRFCENPTAFLKSIESKGSLRS